MNFQEVENSFFKYEEQRHIIIQKTQNYFLKKGFQTYIWFDERHRLRIKYKYQRGLQEIKPKKQKLCKTIEKFSKENNLQIKFILDIKETNLSLKKEIQFQWSTEIILEVK